MRSLLTIRRGGVPCGRHQSTPRKDNISLPVPIGPGVMASAAGGEMRTLRPGREIGIRAPASQHEKDIAIVVWLRQFEALEALGVRHILGGRAERAHELAEVPRVAP
jgi:hypothetical protein